MPDHHNHSLPLLHRRILIVGAGQRFLVQPDPPLGIGRAIALLFARQGARLVCADISSESVNATCQQIASEGGEAFPEVLDVRQADAIAPLVARCAKQLGGLDGLVLNVGDSRGLPLARLTAEAWDDELRVNLRSHMLFAQAALPLMAPGGAIVLMSSISALGAAGLNPAYEASKAAQLALTRSIAAAGEPRGIRCNAVLPGVIDTPMGRQAARRRPTRSENLPFGRQGTAWEVAQACLFLISHDASYVNAHALVVDGGRSAGITHSRADP